MALDPNNPANWPNETDEAAFKAAINLDDFDRMNKSKSNPDPKVKTGVIVPLTDAEQIQRMWEMKDNAIQAAAEAAKPRMVGDFADFMGLFEPAEQVAIKTASLDPANVQVGLWYDQAVAANEMDLTSDKVALGMQALVDAGLITTERRDAILAAGYGPQG